MWCDLGTAISVFHCRGKWIFGKIVLNTCSYIYEMTIILVIKQLQNDKKPVSLNRFIIHTVKLCLNSIEYAYNVNCQVNFIPPGFFNIL